MMRGCSTWLVMLLSVLNLAGCVDMAPISGGVLSTTYEQRITDEAIARDWAAMDALRVRIAAARPRAPLAYAIARAEAELDYAVEEYEENDRTGLVEALLNDARRMLVTQEQGETEIDLSFPEMPGVRMIREDLWLQADRVKHNPAMLHCAGAPVAQLEAGLLELGHEQYEVEKGLNSPGHAEPYANQVDQLGRALADAISDCTAPPPRALHILAASALFHFDRYAASDILPEGRVLLDRFGDDLKSNRDIWQRLVIIGHTDRLGRHAYNLTLSQRRAETVKAYLVQHFGLSPDRIETRGVAAIKPIVFCTGPENDALKTCLQPNRRVEIEVR